MDELWIAIGYIQDRFDRADQDTIVLGVFTTEDRANQSRKNFHRIFSQPNIREDIEVETYAFPYTLNEDRAEDLELYYDYDYWRNDVDVYPDVDGLLRKD